MITPRHSGYSPDGIRLLRIPGLFGGDKPDNSGMNAAAVSQAKMGQEQLDWAKQLYAETAPDRAAATLRANTVSDAQLSGMNEQRALTREYSDYQRDTFRPLERGIVQDAALYDTPERRESEAAKGMADVEQALSTQRGITARNLERSGVNPSSGKALAIQNQNSISGAAMQANAANKARTQVETIGAARKADAANLGRNLASNQATSAGIALNQGNASVSNAMQPGGIAAQGAALMNSGYSGAQQGFSGAANTYGAIGNMNAKANESNNAAWGALGQVGGAFAGSGAGSAALLAFSDKNMKTRIVATNPDQALRAVNKTPVSKWAYKESSAADDGGKTHTGPMAQDVKKNMGSDVGLDGKKIDLVNMNGMLMSAIQGLSQRIDKLSKNGHGVQRQRTQS